MIVYKIDSKFKIVEVELTTGEETQWNDSTRNYIFSPRFDLHKKHFYSTETQAQGNLTKLKSKEIQDLKNKMVKLQQKIDKLESVTLG